LAEIGDEIDGHSEDASGEDVREQCVPEYSFRIRVLVGSVDMSYAMPTMNAM
jgi:hypothetical protein